MSVNKELLFSLMGVGVFDRNIELLFSLVGVGVCDINKLDNKTLMYLSFSR